VEIGDREWGESRERERERLICVYVNGSFNEQTRTPQVSDINSRTRKVRAANFRCKYDPHILIRYNFPSLL